MWPAKVRFIPRFSKQTNVNFQLFFKEKVKVQILNFLQAQSLDFHSFAIENGTGKQLLKTSPCPPRNESLFLHPLSEVKPYQSPGKNKKDEVEMMFDRISGSYDLLNKVLSLGIDRQWRKKALSLLKPLNPKSILDVATGTGDLVFTADKLLRPDTITGIDLSAGMLEVANKRLLQKKDLHARVSFLKGDAEALPFESNSFDAATVAFGVRNFGDL